MTEYLTAPDVNVPAFLFYALTGSAIGIMLACVLLLIATSLRRT